MALVTRAENDSQATGQRIFVNNAVIKMFGADSREQMLERTIANTWIHSERLREFEHLLRSEQTVVDFEACRRRDDGSIWWVALTSHPVIFEGQSCSINWHVDITERKTAESELIGARNSALGASAAKSQFLSSMSHELRTPLNSILGFTQLLAAGPANGLDEKQRRYTKHILEAGQHLLDLITQVLEFTEVESGNRKLRLESVNPAKILEECRSMIAPVAAQQQILVRLAPLAEHLPSLRCDRTAVHHTSPCHANGRRIER